MTRTVRADQLQEGDRLPSGETVIFASAGPQLATVTTEKANGHDRETIYGIEQTFQVERTGRERKA